MLDKLEELALQVSYLALQVSYFIKCCFQFLQVFQVHLYNLHLGLFLPYLVCLFL